MHESRVSAQRKFLRLYTLSSFLLIRELWHHPLTNLLEVEPSNLCLDKPPCNSPGWLWGREPTVWVSFLPWQELETYLSIPIFEYSLFLFHKFIFTSPFEMMCWFYFLLKVFSSFFLPSWFTFIPSFLFLFCLLVLVLDLLLSLEFPHMSGNHQMSVYH